MKKEIEQGRKRRKERTEDEKNGMKYSISINLNRNMRYSIEHSWNREVLSGEDKANSKKYQDRYKGSKIIIGKGHYLELQDKFWKRYIYLYRWKGLEIEESAKKGDEWE